MGLNISVASPFKIILASFCKGFNNIRLGLWFSWVKLGVFCSMDGGNCCIQTHAYILNCLIQTQIVILSMPVVSIPSSIGDGF